MILKIILPVKVRETHASYQLSSAELTLLEEEGLC